MRMRYTQMDRFISKGFITLVLTTLTKVAIALPLGNPIDASLYRRGWLSNDENFPLSLRLGYSADHVFNRRLEVERAGSPDIRRTILNTDAGFVAVNWCDRLDLFATLGASNFRIDTPTSAFSTFTNLIQDANVDLDIASSTDFSWSIGGRGTLFGCYGFIVGIEGAYFSMSPDLDFVKQENLDIAYATDVTTRYSEWQVGTGIAYPISCYKESAFVPYLGIKFAHASLDMDQAVFTIAPVGNVVTLFDAESQLLVGFPIGATITLAEMIGVTVEGRFGDEQAIYVNGQFRF